MEQATQAYLRAEFAVAIALLATETSFASRVLLAQCYLRSELIADAKVAALAAEGLALDREDRAQAAAVLAHALVRGGDLAGAQLALKKVEKPTGPLARADFAYARAFVAFAADEMEDVEPLATYALKSEDVNARIRARNLIAFVYSRKGDLRRHSELLRQSFLEVGTDVYARASTIYQLTILARETALPLAVHELAYAVSTLQWTAHIRTWRFLSIQGLAWHYAVNGSYERAYRYAGDAIECAPSPAWSVGAYADYAQFAVAAGETTIANVQLDRALDIAEKLEWAACKGEERFAMLDLAVLLSRRNQRAAKSLLADFDGLTALSPALAFARDHRARALRAFAGAMQLDISAEATVAGLLEAHSIFVLYNYQWRAAAAASALAEATKQSDWIDVARIHLQDFPHSWLSAAIVDREIELDDRFTVLSPQQRRVVKLVLAGLSDREIAGRLGLAHKTARNHVQAVLGRLDVHSRRTLVAQYNQRAS